MLYSVKCLQEDVEIFPDVEHLIFAKNLCDIDPIYKWLSGKYFLLSNYLDQKSCVARAYEKNIAGKYLKGKNTKFL